jgi:hypothetical protein
MQRILFIGLLALSLLGCEKPVVHSVEFREYEVVGIKRPKHFHVELRDVKSNMRRWVSISKHCNNWRRLKIGSRWTFRTVEYHYIESSRWRTSIEGTRVLCPRS